MSIDHDPKPQYWTLDSFDDGKQSVPTAQELATVWQDVYHDSVTDVLSNDMYGIYQKPDRVPSVVISLDLCEVVRETGLSITRLHADRLGTFDSEYGSYYGNEILGERAQHVRERILPEFMSSRIVPPVAHYEAIQAFMTRWQKKGAYIIANTSTLPGCEKGTIDFLAEYFPSCLQGILFPRNHDGNGTVTKAQILEQLVEDLGVGLGEPCGTVPIVAVEDAHHHTKDYLERNDTTTLFMPSYSWNDTYEGSDRVTRVTQIFGTVDTFIAIDDHLHENGIVK